MHAASAPILATGLVGGVPSKTTRPLREPALAASTRIVAAGAAFSRAAGASLPPHAVAVRVATPNSRRNLRGIQRIIPSGEGGHGEWEMGKCPEWEGSAEIGALTVK